MLSFSDGGQAQRTSEQALATTGEEKDRFASGELCC